MSNASPESGRQQPVIVVFDVNIFLDIFALIGQPFSWDRAVEYLVDQSAAPVPAQDPRLDSLRAVALTDTGRLTATVPLQVWTSDHIDNLFFTKLTQPVLSQSPPEDSGFGIDDKTADDIICDLIDRIVERSNGQSLGRIIIPRNNPPLSHEDGLVYVTGRQAYAADATCDRIVVTRDNHFITSCSAGYPKVLHPAHFVIMVRRLRAAEALRNMQAGF
ncbi:hypothetical protein [Glutamicibacter sp. NPDC087344]|uniref:hypothetical protein n=1 Tax=Glutamicibacter sp. NPDC087344 TaxID=3363994 RepID=UPI0038268594